jgi:hypothetical protein
MHIVERRIAKKMIHKKWRKNYQWENLTIWIDQVRNEMGKLRINTEKLEMRE